MIRWLVVLLLLLASVVQAQSPTPTATAIFTPTGICTAGTETPLPTRTNTGTPTLTPPCNTATTIPTGSPTATPTPPPTCGPTTNVVTTLDEHDDGCCDATDCTFLEAFHANDVHGGTITCAPGLAGVSHFTLPVLTTYGISVTCNDNVELQGATWIFGFTGAAPTPLAETATISHVHVTHSCDVLHSDIGNIIVQDSTFIDNICECIGIGGDGGTVIDLESGSTEITNSRFENNVNTDHAGGVIWSSATDSPTPHITITNSQFINNRSFGLGGGVLWDGGNGSETITGSTFQNNATGADGGVINTAAGGALTITNSTFDGNASNNFGGAIIAGNTGPNVYTGNTFSNNQGAFGTALWDGSSGGSTVTNNTFYGNWANSAVATGPQALIVSSGTITYNTFAQNTGIIGSAGSLDAGTATVNSNIFSGGVPANCAAPITTSTGFNIDSGISCGLGTLDWSNMDAHLGPLQNNGGSTSTMALEICSPAYNTADVGTMPATDQRGTSRPQSTGPDRGAFELVPNPTPTCPPVAPNTCCQCPTPTPGGPPSFVNAICTGDCCAPCVIIRNAACMVVP